MLSRTHWSEHALNLRLAVQRFFAVDRHQQVKEFDPAARFCGAHIAILALREGLEHTRISVREEEGECEGCG